MSKPGLTGNLYGIPILPNTATQLVQAIQTQKDLTPEDALDMAGYLDDRYHMSDYVPTAPPQQPNRPEGLPTIEEILLAYGEAYKYMTALGADFRHRIEHEQALAAIRTRIERAIPEQKDEEMETNEGFHIPHPDRQEIRGYNAAIDEFKSNIQRELGI